MTSKGTNKSLFHPLEISFCGFSGSGKTTLVTSLIERLSPKLDVGYIKHDAHKFEIDKEGKDTWKASQAGSKIVHISSPKKSATLNFAQVDQSLIKQNMVDMDVVIIEGYKQSLIRKILVLGEGQQAEQTLEKYTQGEFENVIAIVGASNEKPVTDIPYFQRDDLSSIETFLYSVWDKIITSRPLYGLILGGGRSVRMGTDKGAINYHGKGQVQHMWELVDAVTAKTFVSCREEQINEDHIRNLPALTDRYLNFGPTGGILSAMTLHPDAAWLVVACDLPYLNEKTLEELVSKRNPFKVATCFVNPTRNWPEPLCTIYEPKAALKLGQYLIQGRPCPRKVLLNSNILKLNLPDEKALDNVNTMEEYQQVKNKITHPEVSK